MAAMDGNPGRNGAREIGRHQRVEETISRDADWPDDEHANDFAFSGDGPEDEEISLRKSHRNADQAVSRGSNPNGSQDAESAENEEDSPGEPDPGYEGVEDGLTDASDAQASSQIDQFWAEEAQLSSTKSVPEDMGTIALERIPLNERAARQVGFGLAAQLAGDMGKMTDAEIMQRAGAGDEACFEFLIAKYRRPIISFLYRIVHNQAVAEELAQEVFLRVYRARATYRAEARFSTWLYRIASNMAINHARDTKFERASSSIFLDQTDEETGTKPDVADLQPIAEQNLLQDERIQRIREHVMALPERQRMAVVMHKYQDMDYRQIGAVLKLSESATKSLLFRAYQTLRERLKEFA